MDEMEMKVRLFETIFPVDGNAIRAAEYVNRVVEILKGYK